ncbi:MAG: hypothetical protein S4CHLAM102_12380 [Chlamydiia bacterium]|nr:hypothetical protein [Chlamydiia bacterium]
MFLQRFGISSLFRQHIYQDLPNTKIHPCYNKIKKYLIMNTYNVQLILKNISYQPVVSSCWDEKQPICTSIIIGEVDETKSYAYKQDDPNHRISAKSFLYPNFLLIGQGSVPVKWRLNNTTQEAMAIGIAPTADNSLFRIATNNLPSEIQDSTLQDGEASIGYTWEAL